MTEPLAELEQKLTHREVQTRIAWLADQWNNPQLRDYYLMQIATEVRRGYVKNPRRVKLKDFVLEFKLANAELTKEDIAKVSQQSKQRWLGMLARAKVKPVAVTEPTIQYTEPITPAIYPQEGMW